MDYNFWDDRTHEIEINPCKGCENLKNGVCVSKGGCADDTQSSDDITNTRCTE